MIGCCGIDCGECEAFIATATNDSALRAKVAAEWAARYCADITPDYINCTGCRSAGPKVAFCEHMCEVRKCVAGTKLTTCAECESYACGKLEEFFKLAPEIREKLNSLRK